MKKSRKTAQKTAQGFAIFIFCNYILTMSDYSKITYKRRVAADYLENVLANLSPGGKLPGIRAMIEQSGVGRTLLEAELSRLEQNGVIELRFRQGRYKTFRSSNKQVLYLHEVLYPAKSPGFNDVLFETIRSIAQERGLEMQLISIANMDEAELLALLKKSPADMVFLGGPRETSRAAFIRKHVRYCVEMFPRHAVTLGAELRNAPATPLQMEYLFQKQYTKIAYIHQVENWNNTPTQLMRLLDYYRIMSEKHLPVYPEWVFQYTYEWNNFNRNMYKMMNSRHLPEVVIAPGSCLKHLYEYCANNGITIGSELAIMGCDDQMSELSPRPTSITNYPTEMARQMWSIMDSLLQGVERHELTNLKIITGETVPGCMHS